MGFLRKLIYATIVPQEVREAVKIDELKKLNKKYRLEYYLEQKKNLEQKKKKKK